MTKEELLSEAISKFPIGTIFNNGSIIGRNMSNVIAGKYGPKWNYKNIIVSVQGGGDFTIYRDGKWADIISGPIGSEPNYSIY